MDKLSNLLTVEKVVLMVGKSKFEENFKLR